jgi:preprotein translocase subunit SecF
MRYKKGLPAWTLLTVMALFLFGGPVLHGFSLARVAGIIVGTYSSIYIVSSIARGFRDFVDARKKKGSGNKRGGSEPEAPED